MASKRASHHVHVHTPKPKYAPKHHIDAATYLLSALNAEHRRSGATSWGLLTAKALAPSMFQDVDRKSKGMGWARFHAALGILEASDHLRVVRTSTGAVSRVELPE